MKVLSGLLFLMQAGTLAATGILNNLNLQDFQPQVQSRPEHYIKLCDDPDYGYMGCHDVKPGIFTECPSISHCMSTQCTSQIDGTCITCEDEGLFFKKTEDGTVCERMCASNNHYCWPGVCGNGLTRECVCAPGFRLVQIIDSETSCQPDKAPSILTCATVFAEANGEAKKSSSSTNSTECQFLNDVYGNFQPSNISFQVMSELTFNITMLHKPNFIKEEKFGVTDSTVYVVRKELSGSKVTLSSHKQLIGDNQSANVNQSHTSKGFINVTDSSYKLRNGQWLCLTYEVYGGGYLKSLDWTSAQAVHGAVAFQKTLTSRDICFRYDDTPPKHCSADGSCSSEPLRLEHRITRSHIHTINFKGWLDPVPDGGTPVHASGIEHYEIAVKEFMQPAKGILQVAETGIVKNIRTTATNITLNLASGTPKLYCISLEVKDFANNVRHARRYLLYDNTSFIETSLQHPYWCTSASMATNFVWQTHHHEVCLSWDGHFVNRFYMENEFLNAIKTDPKGQIAGIYEQIDGVLPISGTKNVYGIIEYLISWSLDFGSFSEKISVPNFLNQSFCRYIALKDGQTYTFNVLAKDIINNTFNENITVHIDQSAPHLQNIWLIKDGYGALYVHDGTDLSKINLAFEALDTHSGILNINWTFAFADNGWILANGLLPGRAINETKCNEDLQCYCPKIGQCEHYNYTISPNVPKTNATYDGTHNRNYMFTLKVTNHAMLSTIEHVDILVDLSPPESGVVYEGPLDVPDIDYTSDSSFIVHWHGFIDHESGIKLYRVGLSDRCLNMVELYNYNKNNTAIQVFEELPFFANSVRIAANFTGKRFITVIAFNNAMSPSSPVCSDGITRDTSPPEIRNLTLKHAVWSESVTCKDGIPWLLHSSLRLVRLHLTPSCRKICARETSSSYFRVLPIGSVNGKDDDISEFLCQKLPYYSNDTIIYVPTEYIQISWVTEEHGSQVDDYFVGLGYHVSELEFPQIARYVSTGKKTTFKQIHSGIGSNSLFYIFIKSVNKAGLQRIITLGPILVDETPPLYATIPTAEIHEEEIVIGWDNDTFYDSEQKSQMEQIFLQIFNNESSVTPLLEWRLDSSRPCLNFTGGCIRYPLKKLQAHDNDLGLEFYTKMTVYNNAGHFTQIITKSFQLPSRYPTGHAVIVDIDPSQLDTLPIRDVNFHFTQNTLCAHWSGFKHHESIFLELGIGTNGISDNVVKFAPINNTNSHCVHSPYLNIGVQYFVLVQSTCSGGRTVSSSNGVTVLNQTRVTNSLHVKMGKDCFSDKVTSATISSDKGKALLILSKAIQVGRTYILQVENKTHVKSQFAVLSEDIKAVNDKILDGKSIISFIPSRETLNLTLKFQESTINETIFVTLRLCHSEMYHSLDDQLSAHWYHSIGNARGFTYKVAILPGDNETLSVSSSYVDVGNSTSHTFNEISLESGKHYMIAVKACTNARCIGPVVSSEFITEVGRPVGTVIAAESSVSDVPPCWNVTLTWIEFNTIGRIVMYQWAISNDDSGNRLVSNWESIDIDSSKFYKVDRCMPLLLRSSATNFACVRAFTEAGNQGQICKTISEKATGIPKTNVIYDINVTSGDWSRILQILSSANQSDQLNILQENELDITSKATKIAGVTLQATKRNVTWYLTTKKHMSTDDCTLNQDFVSTQMTTEGYAIFNIRDIKKNTLHFICACSTAIYIERELFTETLSGIKSCSDGFIFDTIPPAKGTVDVSNSFGFITNIDEVYVTCSGFHDNINSSIFGHVSDIKGYSIAIGTRPEGSDVRNYSDVGIATVFTLKNIRIKNGSPLFVTVKATDHAGHSTTSVSQELIVDTTPPLLGRIHIGDLAEDTIYISYGTMKLHLTGFMDSESGISEFEIGIGSQANMNDIISLKTLSSPITIQLDEQQLFDGHEYFINAKAINGAGLKSSFVSRSFIVDMSAPTGGHVLDGEWPNQKDKDFQSDVSHIKAYWKGFTDIHSGVAFYRVALGTHPYADDVRSMVDIGLAQDIIWNGTFIIGQQYYTTVEACNVASLCRILCSDGVTIDNSPPTAGTVAVGSEEGHQKYIPRANSAHIKWSGFEDPQSGIDHFEVCIGTQKEKCDVQSMFSTLLQSNVFKAGLSLPINKSLFATVIVFNKVGMNTSQTSDSFQVDNTPPIAITKPKFVRDFHERETIEVQWDKSILNIVWEFADNDSYIASQRVTLVTHHEGHSPFEHKILGAENRLTINLDEKNWLHVGDKYSVIITSCNAAGMCSTEKSADILIDSTPPILGGIKPPMLWNNYQDSTGFVRSKLFLTWYGFYDPESSINKYYITVSKTYNGQELSNGVISIRPEESLLQQNVSIDINQGISPNELLILSIWAENKLGLNSSVARVSVYALSQTLSAGNITQQGGIFELQKHSCDVHFCNNDCTCAVIGQPCVEVQPQPSCRQVTFLEMGHNRYPIVEVFMGLGHKHQAVTASSACLSMHWKIRLTNAVNATLHRFEWSLGYANYTEGVGIFDSTAKQPWNDVGLGNEIIYCLHVNNCLEHGQSYVGYVRAWYGADVYAVFKSDPIKVDQTPPSLSKTRHVYDSDNGCSYDVDILQRANEVTACWSEAFIERDSEITHYTVGFGTTIGADDVYTTTNVLLNTNLTLTNLSLSHGTKYFFTVTAYNNVGLSKASSSDGFIIDTEKPVAGVVFNALDHRHEAYQPFSDRYSMSWYGFQDHCSGIKSYFVALVSDDKLGATDFNFTHVGLLTSHTFHNLKLKHKEIYYAIVKASDAVEHESEIAVSLGKTIDESPPRGYTCDVFTVIHNESMEYKALADKNIIVRLKFTLGKIYKIHGSINSTASRLHIFLKNNRIYQHLPVGSNHDGSLSFEYNIIAPVSDEDEIVLSFSSETSCRIAVAISECSSMSENDTSAVQLQQIGPYDLAINIFVLDEESRVKQIELGAGTTPGGFQVKALSQIQYRSNNVLIKANVQHGTPVYVTVIVENYAGLKSAFKSGPIVVDQTEPTISDIALMLNVHNETAVGMERRHVLMATWKVEDKESGLKTCFCSIGHQRRITDIQHTWESQSLVSCSSSDLRLVHGETIYLTVKCVNNVELATEVVAEPLTVSVQPASISKATVEFLPLNDAGYFPGTDKNAVQSNDSCLLIQWNGFDDLSGIVNFQYHIMQGSNSVIDWTSTGRQNTVIECGNNKWTLMSNRSYTAEVRAENSGQYVSNNIKADVFVLSETPRLSGKDVQITKNGNRIELNWLDVFSLVSGVPMYYSLVVGTRRGYTDVADLRLMQAHTYDVNVPESTIISQNVAELFISISCIYTTGRFSVYETIHTLLQ